MAIQKLISPETRATNIKIVTGEAALDGTNPTPVETGLRTIYAVTLALKATAPADGTKVLTYTTTNGRINVYAWTTADGADPTLVDSTGTESFSYIAAGY